MYKSGPSTVSYNVSSFDNKVEEKLNLPKQTCRQDSLTTSPLIIVESCEYSNNSNEDSDDGMYAKIMAQLAEEIDNESAAPPEVVKVKKNLFDILTGH